MERNLPATRDETPATSDGDRMPLHRDRPVSVAFLPLALVTFIVLALVMATWTFLAATT
jgi:hypothetical protein